MDKYKIDLWEGKLPEITDLDKSIIVALKEKLCNSFFQKNDTQCNKFYENIYAFEKVIGHIDDIDLFKKFQNCDTFITVNDFIYLDWGDFDNIIRVKIKDFIENVDNFWYPSSDDLSIFNEKCNWVLSIHHDGNIVCSKALTSDGGDGGVR